MNLLNAIEKVLDDAGELVHATAITRKVINDGLLKTEDKTPAKTVRALLGSEINKNGDLSVFVKTATATFFSSQFIT